MTFRPLRRVFPLLLALASCSAESSYDRPPEAPARLAVHVSLASAGLRLVSVSPASGEEPRRSLGRVLRYTFTGRDGSVLSSGVVEDPRAAHVEWFDDDGAHRAEGVHTSVSLLIRVPAAAGTLAITENVDGEARSYGSVAVTVPETVEPPGTSTEALLSDDDVIGSPHKVVDNGSSARRFDLLFLPEGYTQAELPRFAAAVDRVVAQLSARPDWGRYWSRVNVWRIDVRSRTSGVSAAEPAELQNTAFSLRRDPTTERLIVAGDRRSMSVATELGQRVSADRIVIIANTEYGGAGGSVAVAADDARLAGVVAHELGHSLLGLADEYFNEAAPERSDSECAREAASAPNASSSSDRASLPWSDLVTESTPLPTPSGSGLVGAYLGGDRCRVHRYHPSESCLMGPRLTAAFCPVCQQALDEYFSRYPGVVAHSAPPPMASDTEPPAEDASAPEPDAAVDAPAAEPDVTESMDAGAALDASAPGPDVTTSAPDAGPRDVPTRDAGSLDAASPSPPEPACQYTCASRGYRAGQCYMGWYCDGTCLQHNSCAESSGDESCDYTCAAYGYAPGQCVEGYLCDGVCVRYTGCR